MQKEKIMQYQESLLFNYSDIFYSHYFDNYTSCAQMSMNHSLVYVYSGEMVIDGRGEKTAIGKNECAFIKRDNRLSLTKQPKGKEQYQGIFMMFTRKFLRDFYQRLEKNGIPKTVEKFDQPVVKLKVTPEIASLFQSMTPYFDRSVKPKEEFMQLKLQEGVYILLDIDKRFYPTLFDFTQAWKIDILDFLNENYMYDLSLEEFASYTGRSLATFKRDFKKYSKLPPQKWLMNKRLESAYEMIKEEGKRASDVYLEVGFKNLSHFSTAFKKLYGHSPRN